MTTIAELNALLHTLCDENYPEDVILYGSPEAEVRGALITWMASLGALERAGAEGLNAVICHELFMFGGYQSESDLNSPGELATWPANARRLELANRHGLSIIRSHRTQDAWCIPEVWYRDVLGLGEPVVARGKNGYRFVQVYEIEPTPASLLIERFKATLRIDTIRAWSPDPQRPIRRIGAVWGGVGLFANFYTTAQTLAERVDMVVGGETDEIAAYFFAEAGVDVVELGHQRSEIDGLSRLAPWLAQKINVPVVLHREESPLVFI